MSASRRIESIGMRVKRLIMRLAVLGWLGLAQCNAPPPAPMRTVFDDVPPLLRQVDPQFRDGLGQLDGGKRWPLADGENLDWVLLGVKVRCEGREHVSFVRVAEVIDPEEASGGRALRNRRFEYALPMGVGAIKPNAKFAVRCRRVRVETYDHEGNFVAGWSRLAPEVFPSSSLFEALGMLPQPGPLSNGRALLPATSEQLRQNKDEGLYEMVAVLQALGTTPPMTPIRNLLKEHVVEMPSVFGLLLSGLRPTLTATMTSATPCEFPWFLDQVMVPCYHAEFATLLAGERFFDCRVVAGPSVPPCDLIGGLLVIEVVHPRDRENRLTVRMLASSRSRPAGSEGAALAAK
jgi:hypothetical protein